jgi:hypothetical protein
MHSAGYLSSHGNCIIAAYGHRAPRLSAKACGGLESFSWRAASFHQRSSGSVHSDNRGEEVWHRERIPKNNPQSSCSIAEGLNRETLPPIFYASKDINTLPSLR